MPTMQFTDRDEVLELVKSLMKIKGVGASEIIADTGLSKNTVYSYLRGARAMGSDNVAKILQYLRKRRTLAKVGRKVLTKK